MRNVTHRYGWLFVGVLVALVFLPQVRSFLNRVDTEGSRVLQAVRTEFRQSGTLIREVVSPSSFLTKSGVFRETNEARIKEGMTSFMVNSDLDRIAELRLEDMFEEQYFEHVSPTGRSASLEAEIVGYEYISIGENIALGDFEDDSRLVQAWMDSPGHRANILHETFTELGVAVGKGNYRGRETWIAVQIFAKPLSDCPIVSTSLKRQIERMIESITEEEDYLKKEKTNIEALSRDRSQRDQYDARAQAYNIRVQNLQVRVAELGNLISDYNRAVQLFNQCVESA